MIGCDEGGTARYVIGRRTTTVQVWLDACAWTDGVPVDGYLSVADGGSG